MRSFIKPIITCSLLKKLITILFLGIHLFNIGGQLALHQYFSYITERFFNEQASKGNYNIDDLTEIRIPSNMPGVVDWPAYENIQGQIQFENTSYNYVKMRITRTAIYLMCVPNYADTHLSLKNMICAKNVRTKPVTKKEHVPYGKSTITAKFSVCFLQLSFNAAIEKSVVPFVQHSPELVQQSINIPEQPPRLA